MTESMDWRSQGVQVIFEIRGREGWYGNINYTCLKESYKESIL